LKLTGLKLLRVQIHNYLNYRTNILRMKTLLRIITGVALLLTMSLESCNSRTEDSKIVEQTSTQVQSDDRFEKWKITEAKNDSISQELFKKYPTALKVDTIDFSYTLFFQDFLEKSNNLIFVKEAYIKDIRKFDGNYLITTYSFSPKMITSLYLASQEGKRLTSNLEIGNTYENFCFIANIKELIPISTDLIAKIDDFSFTPDENTVSDEDIETYVHLSLDPSFTPVFFIKGTLIDYSILF
jgi:hypothetical protein